MNARKSRHEVLAASRGRDRRERVPALKGSLTYSRFFVEGALPDDFRERFMKSIRLRAMRPLEPDEDELERSGWAKLGEPMTTELGYDDVFHSDQIVLSFRTDKWQFPGAIVKARTREAEQAYLTKKGQTKLSRREKNELKILVTKRLRKSMAPATRAVDLVWSPNDGIVRFFSHAPKPGAVMSELFKKSFGLTLVPESPYTLAARLGLDAAQEGAWQELEATCVADEKLRASLGVGLVDDAAAEEE
jgi:recombination associated protein RdgC